MYKISIILPVYNVEEYLENCLNSLLNQTIGFNNLEIIFADDCSTDNSFDIIKGYSEKYENVKVARTTENSGGCGQPRNEGMKLATSDYIMYLDPDDTYFENACEVLYSNIINVDADLVSGNYMEYKNGKLFKPMDYQKILNLKGNYLEINNVMECPKILSLSPAVWTKIYKKSFLLENNFEFLSYTVAEDLYYVNQCLLKAKKIVYIDVPIVKYVIREDENKSMSLTSERNVKNLLGYIHVYNKLYDLFNNFNPDLAWMASIHLYFGTIQFVLSNTTKVDKLSFLYNSKKLYKHFKNHYNPLKDYKSLFNLIYKGDYVNSIKIAELMKYKSYKKYSFNFIENKEIVILYDYFLSNKEYIEKLTKILSFFSFNGFNINLVNYNSSDELIGLTNSLSEETFLSKKINLDQINFVNLFEYYSKYDDFGYSDNVSRNLNITDDITINERNIILKKEINSRMEQYTYYKKSDFDSNELDKFVECINEKNNLNNLSNSFSSKTIEKIEKYLDGKIFVKSISKNSCFNEDLYNQNGMKYLTILRKNNKYDLCFSKDNFLLEFNAADDINYYFVTKFISDLNGRPFFLNLTNNKQINDMFGHMTYNLNNFDFDSNNLDDLVENYYNTKIKEIEEISTLEETKKQFDKKYDENILLDKKISEKNKKIKESKIKLKKASKNNQNSLNNLKNQKESITELNRKINLESERYDEILNLKTTIKYYKNKTYLRNRLLLPFSYFYIIFSRKNILTNIKLYRKIKNSNWLDIGFYLNNNKDLSSRKWCEIFSPELHYVCHGFDEKRLPKNNYKNNLTKNEIIEEISKNY